MRTEAGNEKGTSSASDVLVTTTRTVSTESTSVPRALLDLAFWVNVQVHTFGIGTFAVIAEKPALGHLF